MVKVPVTTHYPPWMCRSCGYTADAATTCFKGDAAPRDGDIGVCLNCSAAQVFVEGGGFRPMEARDWDRLEPEERRELSMAQLAQRLAKPGFGDLTEGDGRA